MNTVTKMLLIPEDRFRDPANLILTSNIPSDRKVRLINQIKMKELDKQKGNQNFQAIINSKLTPLQKKKLLENFFGEQKLKVETGVQVDSYDDVQMDDSSEFETPSSSLDTTILDSQLQSEPSSPTTKEKIDPIELPPLQRSPLIKSLRVSAIGAAGLTPKSKKKVDECLKSGVKSIIGLVKNEGIVNDTGIIMRYSNIDSVVKYLTTNDTGRKPIGTDVVVEAIRTKKPYLKALITNPVVLGDKSWKALQKSSERLM